MIPFAAFEPDRSIYNAASTTVALNVRPKADGWGPMPSLTTYSSALPTECLGAVYVRNSAGSVSIFAGTQTGLYRLNSATLVWNEVSRLSGGVYDVPSGDLWSFCYFGRHLVATNINDTPQVFDVEASGHFADLGGSPPRAKYCWAAGDFLILGHLDGFPERIQWSGLDDIAHWIVGEKGCDYQTFPDGQEVQGGITDRMGAFVIQRAAIRYMQFDPSSGYTFVFQSANPTRGTAAPLSIVQIGPEDFVYLSEDGFFRGAAGTPIGAEIVDSWFLGEELKLDEIELVQGVADPFEKVVWWRYTTQTGLRRLLGYDWQLGRWCTSDVAAGFLLSILTPGLTWGGLALLYASIDAVTEPFDSRLFKGGRPTFAGFDTSNRLSYFTGLPLAATVETADVELTPGGRAFVNGFRIITDAPTCTGAVAVSDFHGDARSWKPAAGASQATGLVPARANGRLHRFRATIPAGTDWSRLQGVEPVIKTGGRR